MKLKDYLIITSEQKDITNNEWLEREHNLNTLHA